MWCGRGAANFAWIVGGEDLKTHQTNLRRKADRLDLVQRLRSETEDLKMVVKKLINASCSSGVGWVKLLAGWFCGGGSGSGMGGTIGRGGTGGGGGRTELPEFLASFETNLLPLSCASPDPAVGLLISMLMVMGVD
jgi:hypothetical protein